MWDHPVVSEAVFGNENAIIFLRTIANTLHLWDDLIDKDLPLDDEQVNKAFHDLFITIPCNSFYQKYSAFLHPVLVNAIINWHTANSFEEGTDPNELHIAFIIRSSYIDILTASAFVLGGMTHARKVAVTARKWAHEEGFDQYIGNLARERRTKDVLQQRA